MYQKIINQFKSVEGRPIDTHTIRQLPNTHLKLHVFRCNNENIGLVLALNNHGEKYKKQLITQVQKNGYYQIENNHLYHNNTLVSVPDEETFYRLIK
jgi:hypothetical protein